MTRATSDACTSSSPRDVFEQARRSIVACDANGFADMFAPDGVMEFPFGGAVVGLPACLEGREQIRRHLGAALARSRESGRRLIGYDAVVVHQTTDPEVIIAEFDLHGEVSATGQRYQLPYIQVFRIRDGAIVSLRDYFSVAGLAEVTRLGTPASAREISRRGSGSRPRP